MGETSQSGLSQEELEKFLGELSKYEGGTSKMAEVGAGALRVLSAITSAVSVLSIMMQQVTFQYFIYEEAAQLTEGIIKQLVRCGNLEEARVVLDWYRYNFAPEYINYHIQSKPLAPISWEAFKRDIDSMLSFISEYERRLGV